MLSWSIFILSLATLACSAVQTPSTPTIPFPGAALPTPFVGSTIPQCVRSCVSDAAADANHCESASTCVCVDPEFHQAVATCLQSKCSFAEPQPAFHDQLRRENKIRANTSPVTQQAGAYHTQNSTAFSITMSPEVGSGFFVAILVNLMNLIF